MSSCKTIESFSSMSCLDQARALYDAYFLLLTGKQRVRLQYSNYFVEYRPHAGTDTEKLLQLYQTIRQQCPDAMATLPDLDSSRRVRRGPAAFGVYRG